MQLVQFLSEDGSRNVGLVNEGGDSLTVLRKANSLRELALEAAHQGLQLQLIVPSRLTDTTVDYVGLIEEGRLLPPLDHSDPAHCHVTGTGLTHLGSAKARDSMHAKSANEKETPLTDSMRLLGHRSNRACRHGGLVGAIPHRRDQHVLFNRAAGTSPLQVLHVPQVRGCALSFPGNGDLEFFSGSAGAIGRSIRDFRTAIHEGIAKPNSIQRGTAAFFLSESTLSMLMPIKQK